MIMLSLTFLFLALFTVFPLFFSLPTYGIALVASLFIFILKNAGKKWQSQFYYFLIITSVLSFFCSKIHLAEQFLIPHFHHGGTLVVGRIQTAPSIHEDVLNCHFLIQKIGKEMLSPFLVNLRWKNYPHPTPKLGDQYALQLNIHPHSENINETSFQVKSFTLAKGIKATAEVSSESEASYLTNQLKFLPLAYLRECINQDIETQLPSPINGFISALTVGKRSHLTESEWTVLRNTGTNHLIAIAGLHMGFLLVFIQLLIRAVWRIPYFSFQGLVRPNIEAFFCLFFTSLYSALAGFSLPTLRALLMLSLYFFSTLFKQHITPFSIYFLTLFLLLLYNPFFIFDSTFYLSFGSVGLILFLNQGKHHLSAFSDTIRLQFLLSIGLIPFTLLFFEQISFSSLFANFIAIPLVGYLILPLCFLSLIFYPFSMLHRFFLFLAGKLFSYLWLFLSYLASLPYLNQHLLLPSSPSLIFCFFIAILLLISPKGIPGRWTALIWGLPLFLPFHSIQNGHLQLTLLNAKHSHAILIKTSGHQLLIDAGGGMLQHEGRARSVLLNTLEEEKIEHLDHCILSTTDPAFSSHLAELLKQTQITHFISSNPAHFSGLTSHDCHHEAPWHWDGIRFHFLNNPSAPFDSCLLMLETPSQTLLISPKLTENDLKTLMQTPLPAHFAWITAYSAQQKTLIRTFTQLNGVDTVIFSGNRLSTDLRLRKHYDPQNARLIIDY